jgi:hypothetical protein
MLDYVQGTKIMNISNDFPGYLMKIYRMNFVAEGLPSEGQKEFHGTNERALNSLSLEN